MLNKLVTSYLSLLNPSRRLILVSARWHATVAAVGEEVVASEVVVAVVEGVVVDTRVPTPQLWVEIVAGEPRSGFPSIAGGHQ